jgi:hypothetical protein
MTHQELEQTVTDLQTSVAMLSAAVAHQNRLFTQFLERLPAELHGLANAQRVNNEVQRVNFDKLESIIAALKDGGEPQQELKH